MDKVKKALVENLFNLRILNCYSNFYAIKAILQLVPYL